MAAISRKKQRYPVVGPLRDYLTRTGRAVGLPLRYEALCDYDETVAVYDRNRRDTLWRSVLYPSHARAAIFGALVRLYATLKVREATWLTEHLVTDRVDVCTWGNSQPFRVRIRNTLNENCDYYYVKRADASRIYGLELEHLLSPDKVEFLFDDETIIEEHVSGLGGEIFVQDSFTPPRHNPVRLAKEFVKFNERCGLRLLGDMHPGNYVVSMMPDLDDVIYRFRPIDFDQQSYEPRASVYLPQYYKENNPLVFLATRHMTDRTHRQYVDEERSLVRRRAELEAGRLGDLLEVMSHDKVAPIEHTTALAADLAVRHSDDRFLACDSMGALIRHSLARLSEA